MKAIFLLINKHSEILDLETVHVFHILYILPQSKKSKLEGTKIKLVPYLRLLDAMVQTPQG